MFPFFDLFWWVVVYTFGLTITICFFLYLWMLKKLSNRFGINSSFFFNRLLWYFLSVIFFSRLFYVISRWNDFKFIKDPFEFFIMSDYNFSLFWAIFGFIVVLILQIRMHHLKSGKYIDASVLSFLFILILGYLWAFLWGQVYWRETFYWIEILYTNAFSPVPYEVPIFPLWLVYSFVFFILFSFLYILSMFISIRWLVGYIWLIIFSSLIIILETFSWKYDIFKVMFNYNFSQIAALVLLVWSWYWLYKLYKTWEKIQKI